MRLRLDFDFNAKREQSVVQTAIRRHCRRLMSAPGYGYTARDDDEKGAQQSSSPARDTAPKLGRSAELGRGYATDVPDTDPDASIGSAISSSWPAIDRVLLPSYPFLSAVLTLSNSAVPLFA